MDNEEVKRTYNVVIDVLQSHNYIVDDVNSPEEAENVAEEWLNDGELGEVTDVEILNVDSYPVDSKEEENN